MAAAQIGPRSLQLNMKAGMDGLDTGKINQIIQDVSAGSNYYFHQQKRQKHIDQKILQMKTVAENITPDQITSATEKMDKMAAKLESERRLDKMIVHVDMDAYFAAVEMKNNPELKDKPMAVGCQSMLSTSNYVARRYGVRAAMPGFIAMKLCPSLIIVPPNFDEYSRISKQVHNVFKKYDPHFSSVSLDEAYLDITSYVQTQKRNCNSDDDYLEIAARVVQEMRENIFQTTGLTASAGIAPNMLLAKICSDKNKPNGQFQIAPNKTEILDFIKNLPVRKVNGIGNVTEQLLNSQGVVTCSDLWDKRGLVSILFSSSSSNWFLRVSMGIGSVHVKSDDYMRKSMSVERTFNDTSNATLFHHLCQEMCEELSRDLQAEKIVGRTVTLKLKLSDFTVKTRASTLMYATSESKLIASVAHSLLSNEIKSTANEQLKLRLMGVRVSSLASECDIKPQCTLDTLFTKRTLISGSSEECNVNRTNKRLVINVEDDSKSLMLDESLKPYSRVNDNSGRTSAGMGGAFNVNLSREDDVETVSKVTSSCTGLMSTELNENNFLSSFHCPVCTQEQTCSLQDFNRHVDLCLNKSVIKKILIQDVDKIKVLPKSKLKKRKRNVNIGTIEKFIQRSKKNQ